MKEIRICMFWLNKYLHLNFIIKAPMECNHEYLKNADKKLWSKISMVVTHPVAFYYLIKKTFNYMDQYNKI